MPPPDFGRGWGCLGSACGRELSHRLISWEGVSQLPPQARPLGKKKRNRPPAGGPWRGVALASHAGMLAAARLGGQERGRGPREEWGTGERRKENGSALHTPSRRSRSNGSAIGWPGASAHSSTSPQVRAAACLGAGARLRQPLTASATTG